MNFTIHLLLAVGLACPVSLAAVSANCGEVNVSVDGGCGIRCCCGEDCQCGDHCQCGESQTPAPDEKAPSPTNTTSVELQRILDRSADVDGLDEVRPDSQFERESHTLSALTLTSSQLCSLLGRYLL